jgi:LPS export ABC transporter protein LptC
MKVQRLDSRIFQFIKNIRIAVLVMGTAILVYACSDNDIDKIQAFVSPEDLPVQEAINFETIYTDSGQIRFSLKTPKLLRFENDGKAYVEFPMGMQLVKYDEKQQIISTITADYAKQFEKEAKWEAKNNVVVTNVDGDSLKTDHLIWEEKTEKIYTDEFVKIISENQTITGLGLTSDQNMANWKIKNVKGIIYVDVKEKSQETKQTGNELIPINKEEEKKSSPQAIKFK